MRSAARLRLARSQSSCSLQRMRTADCMRTADSKGSLRLQLARLNTVCAQRCQIATGALTIVFQTTSRAGRRLQGESKAATGTLASILRSTTAVFGARRRQKVLASALVLVIQHFVKGNANVISIKSPSTSPVRGAPVTQLAAPAHSSLSMTASDNDTVENIRREPPRLRAQLGIPKDLPQ